MGLWTAANGNGPNRWERLDARLAGCGIQRRITKEPAYQDLKEQVVQRCQGGVTFRRRPDKPDKAYVCIEPHQWIEITLKSDHGTLRVDAAAPALSPGLSEPPKGGGEGRVVLDLEQLELRRKALEAAQQRTDEVSEILGLELSFGLMDPVLQCTIQHVNDMLSCMEEGRWKRRRPTVAEKATLRAAGSPVSKPWTPTALQHEDSPHAAARQDNDLTGSETDLDDGPEICC